MGILRPMKSRFKLSLSQAYFLGVWITLMAIAGLQSWSRIVEAKVSPAHYSHRDGDLTIERRASTVVTPIHSGDASHTDSNARRLDKEKSST